MVLFQKGPFFQLLFLGNIAQENVFYDILEQKNAFLGCKNKKWKKSKRRHFPKRVYLWFWSKNVHFSNFFFLGNIGQENVFYDTLEGMNAFLGYKNKNFENSKNWHFFKGVSPWFWFKNVHFFNFFFLDNIRQENVFYDILERKTAFLGYKNKNFKNQKIDGFPKGSTHSFVQNMAIFPTLFLGNVGQENVFYDILESKNAFLGYKNKKFKNSKNWHFSKGVNPWYWSKNGHFSNFFF